MATNQEDGLPPPPYSFSTPEELDAINPYPQQQMLAIRELDDLFHPRNVMVAVSIGLFLSALFMILAGEVTTMTLRWDLLAKICFIIGGGIMSGPFWMMWQKNEVKQTHVQRFMAQNDTSYLEKAPEKAESESVDSDQKVTIDADVEKQEPLAFNYSMRYIALVLAYVLLIGIGWLIILTGVVFVIIDLPVLSLDLREAIGLGRPLTGLFIFFPCLFMLGSVLIVDSLVSLCELFEKNKAELEPTVKSEKAS